MSLTTEKKTPKIALLINDTTEVYHWGCYGTSHAIREQLRLKGVEHIIPLSVNVIHKLSHIPMRVSEFGTKSDFEHHFPPLAKALTLCNYVVVNGEGTIHDFRNGPRALLYIMYAAKTWYAKPVYLINHSCYPNSEDEQVLDYYRAGYQSCDYVAARETTSKLIIEKMLGKACVHAFDSLPLSIYQVKDAIPENIFGEKYICISGAVNYDPARSEYVAKQLLAKYPNHRFVYLVGSWKEGMNKEEPPVFNHLKGFLPALELYDAKSLADFLSIIKHATLLVSGRYHYFIAALCLASRQLYFPSNTPKIDAVAFDLKIPFAIKNELEFNQALANVDNMKCKNYLEPLCRLALNNYKWTACD